MKTARDIRRAIDHDIQYCGDLGVAECREAFKTADLRAYAMENAQDKRLQKLLKHWKNFNVFLDYRNPEFYVSPDLGKFVKGSWRVGLYPMPSEIDIRADNGEIVKYHFGAWGLPILAQPHLKKENDE